MSDFVCIHCLKENLMPLTVSEFKILNFLLIKKTWYNITKIQKEIEIPLSTVDRLVKQLYFRGYLERNQKGRFAFWRIDVKSKKTKELGGAYRK